MRIFKAQILSMLLVLAAPAHAAVVDCELTLLSATLTATGNGSVIALPKKPFGTFYATATYNSGTTATLDMTIQTCPTSASASCVSTGQTFTQCTTSTCYVDGGEGIDFANANVLSYARIAYTLSGTAPNYTVAVYYCSGGR